MTFFLKTRNVANLAQAVFSEDLLLYFSNSHCHSPLPAGVRTASIAFIDNQKEWDMATPRRSNLLVKSYLRCSQTAKW